MTKQSKTSWESSAKWYDVLVGEEGHYYHENVIFPHLLPLMDLKGGDKILDLACGQGVLARKIPKGVDYTGVDTAKSLILAANQRKLDPRHRFVVGDVTKPLAIDTDFTHATVLLALQNIEDPLAVLQNASKHLKKGGRLFIVLNHPCFRIPRQSQWGWDEQKKLQYRRLDAYLSPQKIPIQMHPGKEKMEETISYHFPLSAYSEFLQKGHFVIEGLQEWVSDKTSTGAKAKMENRARQEFPLFLTIIAKKIEP